MRLLYTATIISVVVALCACDATFSPQVRNDIAIQVASQQKAMQACYADALKRDKTTAGKANLTFIVAPDGTFRNVQLDDGVQDAELKTCVVSYTNTLRLAKPPGRPVVVSYPLSFEPEPVP